MKNLLLTLIVGFGFSGCAVSSVNYNSYEDKSLIYKQYIEHQECKYMVGPFLISDKPSVEKLIEDTIKKGNEQGMYGDKLINVEIKEGGLTAILFSKLCLYAKGNIVYSK